MKFRNFLCGGSDCENPETVQWNLFDEISSRKLYFWISSYQELFTPMELGELENLTENGVEKILRNIRHKFVKIESRYFKECQFYLSNDGLDLNIKTQVRHRMISLEHISHVIRGMSEKDKIWKKFRKETRNMKIDENRGITIHFSPKLKSPPLHIIAGKADLAKIWISGLNRNTKIVKNIVAEDEHYQKIRPHFDAADKDKNGILERAEVFKFFELINLEITEKDLKVLNGGKFG